MQTFTIAYIPINELGLKHETIIITDTKGTRPVISNHLKRDKQILAVFKGHVECVNALGERLEPYIVHHIPFHCGTQNLKFYTIMYTDLFDSSVKFSFEQLESKGGGRPIISSEFKEAKSIVAVYLGKVDVVNAMGERTVNKQLNSVA